MKNLLTTIVAGVAVGLIVKKLTEQKTMGTIAADYRGDDFADWAARQS